MSFSTSGRPLKSTTASGLPGLASLIALMSSSCLPGRSSIERASASPLISRVSPTASTIWSAACEAVTAAAKPSSDPHSFAGSYRSLLDSVQPGVHVTGSVLLHALEQRHRVLLVAAAPPRAEHVVPVVAERADQRGRLGRVDRQRVAVVLQQHLRALRCPSRRGTVLGQQLLALRLRHVRVRMLEQPRAELHAQDAAHRVVDAAHRHLTAPNELRPEVAEVRRDHLGVGAGVQCLTRRVGAVLGDAVAARAAGRVHARALPQLRDGGVVALDESVEAPSLLEDLRLRVLVGAGGHVVERVEARTSRCRRRRRPPP